MCCNLHLLQKQWIVFIYLVYIQIISWNYTNSKLYLVLTFYRSLEASNHYCNIKYEAGTPIKTFDGLLDSRRN